jgi:hypothetical protein
MNITLTDKQGKMVTDYAIYGGFQTAEDALVDAAIR